MSIDLGSAILTLSADASRLNQVLNQAQQQTQTWAGQVQARLGSLSAGFARIGTAMTAAVSAPLIAIGSKAVSAAMDYESAMNMLQAVSGATTEQMGRVSDLAIKLGADMALPATSAADAGNAMLELSKAGLAVEQTMAAAKGTLQLAAAGQLSEARAAEINANALNAFKLAGDQATRVADLLAAAANASSGSVTDMADSLRMASAVAASAGMPIEDVVAGLSEMANQGLKGSDAGTSFKQMLLSLQAPTSTAAAVLQELGIRVYDVRGQMLPLREIIQRFNTALRDQTQEQRNAALAAIFGSDAVRAANTVLMQGTDAYDKMRAAVTKQGAAQELAGAQMKGLRGALAGLGSQLETVLLQAALPFLAGLERLARGLADFIGRLQETNPAVLKIGVVVAAAIAAIGPLLLGFSALTGIAGSVIGVIGKLRVAFAGVGLAFKALAGPIGWAMLAAGALAVAWQKDFLGLRTTVTNAVQHVGSTVNQLGVIFNLAKQKTGSTVEAVRYTIGALGDLAPALKPLTNAVVGVIGTFQREWPKAKKAVEDWWAGARPMLEQAWTTIRTKVGGALQNVGRWAQENWPKVRGAIETFWAGAYPKLRDANDWIADKLGGALQGVGRWAQENWPKVRGAIETFWAGAKDKVREAAAQIGDKLGGALQNIGKWAEESWPKVKTAIVTFWAGAKDKVTEAATQIGDKLGGAIKDVGNWAEQNWPKVKTAIADAWDKSKDNLGNLWHWIEEKLGAAMRDLATTAETEWPKMQTAVNSWWEGVKEGLTNAHTFFSTTLPEAFQTVKDKLQPVEEVWTAFQKTAGEVNGVLLAFQDVMNAIGEKAGEWGKVIFEYLHGKLQEVGGYLEKTFTPAWNTLKGAFEDIGRIIGESVLKLLGDLGIKMGEVQGPTSLLSGVMDTLKNAINGIGDAARSAMDWLAGLAEKIRNLPSPPAIFTPHSPTPFEMGIRGIGAAAEAVATSSLPALANSLTSNFAAATPPVQNFLDLIQQLIGMSGDNLGELGERLRGVGEGMQAMVEALTSAGAYRPGNVTRTWAGLRTDMEFVIDQLFQLAELYAAGHKHISAKAFTDAVEGSFSAVKSIVDGLIAVANYEAASNLVPRMARLSLDLQVVVDELFKLAETYATTKRAPDTIQVAALTAPVQAVAEVLDSLRGIAAYRGATNIAERVTALVRDVDAVVVELARLGPGLPLDEAQAALKGFGEKLGGLVGPFEEAIGFWGQIKEMAENGGGPAIGTDIYLMLKGLLDELGLLALALAEAKNDSRLSQVDKELADFAERIGGLTAPFAEGLSLWRELDDLARNGQRVEPGTDTYYTLTQLMFQAAMLALALESAAQDPRLQGITDYMVQLGERISALTAPFSSMLAFWGTLQDSADVAPPADDKLRGVAGRIIDQLGILAEELATAVSSMDDWGLAAVNDGMVQFAQRLGGLTAPFEAMLGFWSQLQEAAGNAPPTDDALRGTVRQVLAGYNVISQEITSALSSTGGGPLLQIDQFMIDLAGRLGQLGQALGQALDFLTNLGAWKAADNLAVLFAAFISDWKSILTQLTEARLETTIVVNDDLRRLVKAAGELGEGLTKALDFLTALGVWEAAPDLVGRAKTLSTALSDVLDLLKPTVDDWSSDGLKLAGEFGQAIGSVMSGLKSGLDLALALPATWAPPSATVWTAFFNWATGVFASFVQKVREWTGQQEGVKGIMNPDDATVVGQIAGAFGDVMGALKSALDLALAVPATWQAPDPATWAGFFNWATGVFASFVQRVKEWTTTQAGAAGPLVGQDDSTLIGQVAGAFGSVMSALKSALDLALAVPATWTLPDAGVFDGFITWAMGVFATFATKVKAWAATQTNPADQATLVGTVAQAFGSVMQGLADALEVLNGLVWYVGPAESRITSFLDAVKLVFSKMAEYAQGALTEAQATATKTFADVMSGLFGALQTAIGLLEALDKFAIDPSEQGSFAHRVQRFNAALSLAITSWMNWIVKDLDPNAAKLVADFSGVVETIAQGFRSALDLLVSLNEAGLPTMDKLEKALALILRVFGDFSTDLAAAVKPQDWEAIGRGMVDGLVTGIEAERGKLIKAAQAASYDAYLAVKQALGIASPSKLFAGLGLQLPAGLAQGIVQGAPVVRRALGSLYAQAGLGDVQVGTRSEQHIYLHGDGMSGLSASERRSVVDDLAKTLRLQGLRVGVA